MARMFLLASAMSALLGGWPARGGSSRASAEQQQAALAEIASFLEEAQQTAYREPSSAVHRNITAQMLPQWLDIAGIGAGGILLSIDGSQPMTACSSSVGIAGAVKT